MEIYFLGTGAGMPSQRRSVSSLVLNLLDECGSCWMFDCGEGTQHQILRAPVKLKKLNKLFITHLHGDHIFGIPGMLSSRSNQGGDEPFAIFGPTGIRKFVETCLEVSESRINNDVQCIEIDEGIIYEDESFIVEAAYLQHRTTCFGFRVVEKDLPGSLNVEKLRKLGVPAGPLYGKLKNGMTVQLPDGSVVDGKEMIGPPIPGRIVAIMGDTLFCEGAVRLSAEADVVVHEATFAQDKTEQAEQFYHATTAQAAAVAAKANASMLILNHISSRYSADEEGQLLSEARSIFPNTHLSHDFASYQIPRR